MQRLCQGDDRALNGLMQLWQGPLVAYLYRFTGNHHDALDLAQETFVRVYASRARYEPRAKFSTWLFTIAANLCRNHARWRERHPTVSLHGPEDGGAPEGRAADLPAAAPNPSDAAARQDLAEAVRTQVQRLPEELRAPLILSEYEQLSQAEIAGVLGCTVKAVETRLYRARERLRKALAAWKNV